MSPPAKNSHPTFEYDHVLITGASGGIGQALARHYAKRAKHMSLWGRDVTRLTQIAQECSRAGVKAHIATPDMSDIAASRACLEEAQAHAPVDLAFFNAGVSDILQDGEIVERPDAIMEAALVNFAVPVTLASIAAAAMARRGRGAIVFTGSVAAWHELPFAAAYAASKSGLERFAGALRASVASRGVGVTHVALGFVDTRMSRRLKGYKPFIVSPDAVVKRMARAVELGRATVVYPRIFGALRILDALTPRPLVHHLLRSIRVKQIPRDEVSS